jgi:hypothetical protein
MQLEQQQELSRLTKEATDTLDAAPESGSFTHVFSFWSLPSFGNHTRTTLYTPRKTNSDRQPFYTVTTWRRDIDAAKLRNPVERLKHPRVLTPTIEDSSTNIASDAVARIVTELGEISLPVLRPSECVLGLDGIGFRFSFSQGFYALDLSWWAVAPTCWRDATKRIEDLVSTLTDLKDEEAEQDVHGNTH